MLIAVRREALAGRKEKRTGRSASRPHCYQKPTGSSHGELSGKAAGGSSSRPAGNRIVRELQEPQGFAETTPEGERVVTGGRSGLGVYRTWTR